MTNTFWLTDSRQLTGDASNAIFFAIRGEHHDGHNYIGELYQKGVRQFVVETAALTGTPGVRHSDRPGRRSELATYPGAQFTEVDSSLRYLQTLAAQYRRQFRIPIIGITGSNGKTIVKEWLAQLLADRYVVARSPRSYNSQLGVPLSVRELTDRHTLGIFEAGISKPHEMTALETIIRPTIGIFTNIGTAHDEGFRTRRQKIAEKLRLFINAQTLIYCADYADVDDEVRMVLKAVNPDIRLVTWSLAGRDATYQVRLDDRVLYLEPQEPAEEEWFFARLPSYDAASVENLVHCLVAARTLGITDRPALQAQVERLRPVTMRLEQKEGINNCVLIDDSYNNDVLGIQLALNFLGQLHTRNGRVVILSDVLQSGRPEAELYEQIAALLQSSDVAQFVGIGPMLRRNNHLFASNSLFYEDTDAFLAHFPFSDLRDSAVLVKGARPFSFERIVNRLQRKVHGTVLEVNLDALAHNLNYYREKVGQRVGPSQTKIMVMVKAFAYGSGSAEVAQLLQFQRVDWLAVAYADEGVSLRQQGITLPIMVMNPAPETFATLLEYQLEPEVYSMRVLREWSAFSAGLPAPRGPLPSLHLKIDTGMHRLGFLEEELCDVIAYLRERPDLHVATVFSHLVGADESQLNAFSHEQAETFTRCTALLEAELGYRPLRHLLNSAGIVRFPDYRFDMVRLGIGLYGVESSGIEPDALQPVGSLRTVISQIKHLRAGQTVGYSRRGVLEHDARIATIAIGYADGFDRRLGNGAGQVWVNGTLCPTVGNVCMDMTMIDVTNASAYEGDEVIIFGPERPIADLARQIDTIPYEILTGVSERVKRVFVKQ